MPVSLAWMAIVPLGFGGGGGAATVKKSNFTLDG
jgi:hypothetical protein